MFRRALLSLPLWLLACHDPADSGRDSEATVAPVFEDVLSAADGWLVGDLHAHTDHSSDGFDDVATQVALGEALEDPVFLAAHPEYAGHGLDFLAFTDHGNVDAALDVDFASDRLVLIPGAEWNFSVAEANLHGLTAGITVDLEGDGVDGDDVRAAVETVHGLGVNFSVNHPMAANYPFAWDVRSHDSLEVWNAGWALSVPPADETTLKEWEAARGEASPFWRRAIQAHALHAGGEALVLYEAMLARGVHVAAVGGSDRHILFLPGFPATRVLVDGDLSLDGVLAGIRSRHTLVQRGPAGPQVLLELEGGMMGDQIAVTDGQAVVLEVQTARAAGGLLRIVQGHAVDSDEGLQSAELGQVVHEVELSETGAAETWELVLEVAPGDWLYPVIIEPTVPAGAEADHGEAMRDLARASAAATTDFTAISKIAGSLMDPEVFADPGECDPEEWETMLLQCVVADQRSPGTFFVPDLLQRAFHAMTIDGEPTGWTMGAIGSAVLFVEEPD